MKKVLIGLFLLATIATFASATPPLDRYGGAFQVTPDTTTGVRYKYWVEPNPNEFEYRAMMDDIYAISKSTVISECSRLRIVNTLLEKRVDPYLKYPPGVFRSSIPFDENSLIYLSTTVAVDMGRLSTTTVNASVPYSTITICTEGHLFESFTSAPKEAELATLTPPMQALTDTQASGGYYVESFVNSSGTIAFNLVVPFDGTYTIWARVLSRNDGTDSFYVSVDTGTEDVYDTSDGTWSSNYQWTRVNGRNGTLVAGTLNPRTFNLSKGPHVITFRTREPYTGLDKIVITNEPSYVPDGPL